MKIETNKDELIVRIPRYQTRNNPYDEKEGLTDNLMGVITHEKGFVDYTISQLIDLSYKGDQQEGMPILHLEKDEWEAVVQELNLTTIEHPECVKCGKTVYGAYSWDNGEVCFECEKDRH